jgi:hypothetical protein
MPIENGAARLIKRDGLESWSWQELEYFVLREQLPQADDVSDLVVDVDDYEVIEEDEEDDKE